MNDWLSIAKTIRQGARIRTVCSEGCGTDKSQIISHSAHGFSRHCFRCGTSAFKPHGTRSIADIERHKKERALLEATSLALPDDFTLHVPAHAAVWYYKYGISAALAREYGIGYTPDLDRIVLQVREDSKLTALQLRAVQPGVKPKYINPGGASVASALFYAGDKQSSVVVVEDIISAIKVGRVHFAASILGTNLTDQRLAKLARDCTRVILWLDNDKAGDFGYQKASRKLELIGLNYRRVRTEKDPKAYSLDDIRSILHD